MKVRGATEATVVLGESPAPPVSAMLEKGTKVNAVIFG